MQYVKVHTSLFFEQAFVEVKPIDKVY